MRRILAIVAACLGLAGAVRAQEGYERVELRVSATPAGGIVVVDRGEADGLVVGDLVFFHPREGVTKGGNVVSTEPRSARVELHDRALTLPLGTRGEVRVPASRFAPEPDAAAEEDGEPPKPAESAAAEEPAEDAITWTDPDDEYTSDQPLLTRMRPVKPEERAMVFSGRVYVNADGTFTTLDDRRDAFLRTGADLLFENPFQRGGALHVDGELNYRQTELPDQGDESFGKLRLDRLSYASGGTRFEELRWEAGRFLQHGLPELGVLDGVEWGWRRRNGDSYGFSVGYMPEPDPDFTTGKDFQVAARYRWVLDREKNFTVDGAYQKTFHHGNADRDLFVGKLQYAPADEWNLFATTWIDYYGSSDSVKGTSLDLTQAYILLTRSWETRGVSWNLTHLRFPELEREEFRYVEDDQLEDDYYDRLAVSGWQQAGAHRLHGQLGGWLDEDEEGFDADLGVDFADLVTERSHTDVTGFVTFAEFTNTVGGQLAHGQFLDDGRWDLFYEYSFQNNVDFDDDVDDIIQHRLRVSRDYRDVAGWSVSLSAEVRTFDDEGSLTLGLYMQRSY